MSGSILFFCIHQLRLEVDLSRRTHGGLDVKNLDVLPSFFQQWDKEVHSKLNVQDHLLLSHLHVTDGDVQAHYLFELELDGGFNLVHFVLDILLRRHTRRELTRSVKTGSEQTGNELDNCVRSQEGIVLGSKLLHQLLVLVESLQVLLYENACEWRSLEWVFSLEKTYINRHERNVELFTLIDVDLIGKNADLHVRFRCDRKLVSTGETLEFLDVVVCCSSVKC